MIITKCAHAITPLSRDEARDNDSMLGLPETDVDVFLKRLSLLRVWELRITEFKTQLKEVRFDMQHPSPPNYGEDAPFFKGGKIVYERITTQPTQRIPKQPHQNLIYLEEELETKIIQYQTEIDYLNDVLDLCSDVVKGSAIRIFAEGENIIDVASDVLLDRSWLSKKIKSEIGHALKSPHGL